MSDDGTNSAPTGVSTSSVCPRCGLKQGGTGSLTFWVFRDNRCRCDLTTEAPEPVNSLVEPSLGKQILNSDRFELNECVGQGAMGSVYKGRDLTTGKAVALKVMHRDLSRNEHAVRRVRREVDVVSGFHHSNLGEVYGYGQDRDGAPYLVMEFVDGKNLDQMLKSAGKLNLRRSVDIFMQICAGLICAHTNGVIHRDLKPSNIIIEQDASGHDRVKIVDFGFAKLLREPDELRVTQEGEAFGSPAYMSPEQCLGEELDSRSDIYSFGCLMYETLTGIPPLVGENVLSTVAKQVRETPLSMRTHDASIPESIDVIVSKCLAKEPVLRYQSVHDLRADLEKVKRGEQVIKTSAGKARTQSGDRGALRSTEQSYRNTMSLIGVVVVVACLVGGGSGIAVWMIMQKQSSTTQAPAPNPAPPKETSNSNAKADTAKNAKTVTENINAKVPHSAAPTVVPEMRTAPRHATTAKHSKPRAAGPATGWDQLKKIRMYK